MLTKDQLSQVFKAPMFIHEKEVSILNRYARAYPNVLEIGAGYGSTAVTMLLGGAKVISVDPFIIDSHGNWSATEVLCSQAVTKAVGELAKNWKLFPVSSFDFSYSEPIEMLFIDGSHHYEDVKHDFEKFSKLVVPGGVVLFHDSRRDNWEDDPTDTVFSRGWTGPTTLAREIELNSPDFSLIDIGHSLSIFKKKIEPSISLVFSIYNKQNDIIPILDSWVENLSGETKTEFILVFDTCKDKSQKFAETYLESMEIPYKTCAVDGEKYEIYCQNLGLDLAKNEYVVFAQDDNWIYTKDWDKILINLFNTIPRLGTIGMLAGVYVSLVNGRIMLHRIETTGPHKERRHPFNGNMNLYSIPIINRPFATERRKVLGYGKLDTAYSPTHGDDVDLSLKYVQDKYNNVYYPFDLKNTSGCFSTYKKGFLERVGHESEKIWQQRYSNLIPNIPDVFSIDLWEHELSIVVCIRNDNYEKGFQKRFTNFLESVSKFNAELIVVDWNSPNPWKKGFFPKGTKLIHVPTKIHSKMPNSQVMPIFEFIGKNVGIRRAKGKFILVTNADILFPDDIINRVTQEPLNANCMYRAIRVDYNEDGSIKRKNTNTIRGIVNDASGDFLLASSFAWHKVRGYPEIHKQQHADTYVCLQLASFLEQVVLGEITHQYHSQKEGLSRPQFDANVAINDGIQAMEAMEPHLFNKQNWGMFGDKLRETVC